MKKVAIGCAGAVVIALLLVGLGAMFSYNRLVSLEQQTDQQWAQVQNVYQRRADLVPNLVRTVSGAAQFEKSTLTEVTEARASVGRLTVPQNQAPETAEQLRQFQQAQDQLSSALSRLLVVVERYPEIRATQNFRDLQAQLEGTENRIAVERRKFNQDVQAFNTAVKRFPTMLWARLMGFGPRPYFSAQAGAETAPTVEFPGLTPAPQP